MREEVSKSVALNRKFSDLLARALELDRAIKIGWGKGDDPKPHEGEMGVAPHIPKGARVRMLGNLADMVAVCASGGSFILEGEAAGYFGAWNDGCRLIVERDCGARAGYAMASGRIVLQGSAGAEVGARMGGGNLIVRGSAGRRCGAGMSGGTVVVIGDVDGDVGCNMSGGRIIVNGRCPPAGEGAISNTLTKAELKDVNELLDDLDLKVAADAVCIRTDEDTPTTAETPAAGVDSDFSGISLVSATGTRLHEHAPLDLLTLISNRDSEKGAVLLPLPVLPLLDDGKGLKGTLLSLQPCLVRSAPRAVDLLLVDESNLTGCAADLQAAAGAVVSIHDLPPLNDAELDALLVVVRSHLGDDKPVILSGDLTRVQKVHRLADDLDCDGACIQLASSAMLPAAAALPVIALSGREQDLAAHGVSGSIHLPWSPAASDLLIAAAAGANLTVADPFTADASAPSSQKGRAEAVEAWLAGINSGIRGWLIELGEDGIDRLNRRHLRALDHDTASVSGLRLAGWERPLPQWLGQ